MVLGEWCMPKWCSSSSTGSGPAMRRQPGYRHTDMRPDIISRDRVAVSLHGRPERAPSRPDDGIVTRSEFFADRIRSNHPSATGEENAIDRPRGANRTLAYDGVRLQVARPDARRWNARHCCAPNRRGLIPAAFALMTDSLRSSTGMLGGARRSRLPDDRTASQVCNRHRYAPRRLCLKPIASVLMTGSPLLLVFSPVTVVGSCLAQRVPKTFSLQNGFVNALIAYGPIAGHPAFVHPRQDGNPPIHIVVDPRLGLPRMQSMQPSCVLHDGAPPRDRHGQEQGVQSRLVEALPDVPPGRKDQEFLAIGYGGQSGQRLPALLRADTSLCKRRCKSRPR